MPGPPPHIWQRDPTAPLGSFLNPLPRVVYKRSKKPAATAPAKQSQSYDHSRSRDYETDLDEQPASTGAEAKSEPQKADQRSTASSRPPSIIQSRNDKQKKPREVRHVHFEDDEVNVQVDRKEPKAASPRHRPNLEGVFKYVDANTANPGRSPRHSSPAPMPETYRRSPPQTSQATSGQSARPGSAYMTGALPYPPPRPPKIPPSGHNASSGSNQPSTHAAPSKDQPETCRWSPPINHSLRRNRNVYSDLGIRPLPDRPESPPKTRDFGHGQWPVCPMCNECPALVEDYCIRDCHVCIHKMARQIEREAQSMAKHTCVVCEDRPAEWRDGDVYFCRDCSFSLRECDYNVKGARRRRGLLCMVCDERLYTITKGKVKFCDGCFMEQMEGSRNRGRQQPAPSATTQTAQGQSRQRSPPPPSSRPTIRPRARSPPPSSRQRTRVFRVSSQTRSPPAPDRRRTYVSPPPPYEEEWP
ncbi:MAG: hypothetical protein LQ352_005321, partial [Teloschistes flavicans]